MGYQTTESRVRGAFPYYGFCILNDILMGIVVKNNKLICSYIIVPFLILFN